MDCVFDFEFGYIWGEAVAKQIFEMLINLNEESRVYSTYDDKNNKITIRGIKTESVHDGTYNFVFDFLDFKIEIIEGQRHYITYLVKSNNEREQYVLVDNQYILKLNKLKERKLHYSCYETIYIIEDIIRISENDLLKLAVLDKSVISMDDDIEKNKFILKKLYDKAINERKRI